MRILTKLAGLFVAAQLVLGSAVSFADQAAKPAKKGLSARAVNVLVNMSFSLMPEVYTSPNGKKIVVDKKNKAKVIVPVDDARRVIEAAQLSAYAQACDMPALQTINYNHMMAFERFTKGWSDQQTLFISQLHLFTTMWLSGNTEITASDKDGKNKKKVETKIKKLTCNEERKIKVKAAVEEYVKHVSVALKALKKKKASAGN